MDKRMRSFITATVVVVMLTGVACHRNADDSSEGELAEFLITVERTEDGVSLTCAKGCAWTNLSWGVSPYVPQAVDQYGMAGD
jgi:hypothetical protein